MAPKQRNETEGERIARLEERQEAVERSLDALWDRVNSLCKEVSTGSGVFTGIRMVLMIFGSVVGGVLASAAPVLVKKLIGG